VNNFWSSRWRWLAIPVLAGVGYLLVIGIQFHARNRANGRELSILTTRMALAHYVRDQEVGEAREDLLEAIKDDPSYIAPYFYLGLLAEQQEDWEGAIASFDQICRIEPYSKQCAGVRLETKRLTALRTDSPEALKNFRYSRKVSLANSALEAGLLKRAVFFASQASSIDNTRWEAYAIGAAALAKQKDFDGAANFLGLAMSRAPADVKRKLQTALDQCGKEKQYAAFALAGAQALQAKQYQTAAQQFENAWKLFPDRAEYRFAEALALANSGNHDKAVGTIVLLESSHDPATAKKARDMLAQLSVRTSSVASSTTHARHTRHVTHTTTTKSEPF
jgi:tetratricopeptide (TPR) repeat protein